MLGLNAAVANHIRKHQKKPTVAMMSCSTLCVFIAAVSPVVLKNAEAGWRASVSVSPVVDHLGVPVLQVVSGWIDGGGDAFPPRAAVVEIQRDAAGRLPVSARVDERRKGGVPICRPAYITEHFVVICAAAEIPEVPGGSQPQPMQIGANGELARRLVGELHELVRAVHQVVERGPGVNARCGQELEEGVVR